MKLIVSLLTLLIPFWSNGQEWKKTFHDKSGAVTDESISEYYVLEKEAWNSPSDTLKSYYTEGNALRSLSVVNQVGLREGTTTYYHKNGNVRLSANYYNGSLRGDVVSYYPDGKMQSIETYTMLHKSALQDYWDSLGNQIIKEGTGFCRCVLGMPFENRNLEIGKMTGSYKDSVWIGLNDTGRKYYEEEYNNGELVKGFSVDDDGNQYEYTVMEEPAEYPGGIQEVYKHVSTRMQYPKEARKKGIEGKVFVEFVLEKDGSVTNVKVIKGIGGGCDEVAMDAISSLQKWKPGKQRGKPVRQRMVMPLIFKLS